MIAENIIEVKLRTSKGNIRNTFKILSKRHSMSNQHGLWPHNQSAAATEKEMSKLKQNMHTPGT